MKSVPNKKTQRSKLRRKNIARRSYLLLASLGLLTLMLWPSLVTAVPLTDQHQFDRVWALARDIGQYDFNVRSLQTNNPTPRIENVGRSPETTLMTADGSVDRPTDEMSLNLWTDGNAIQLRIQEGVSYGRTGVDDAWIELDEATLLFAPGNDLTGFAYAAVNVEEVENWRNDSELDTVTAVRVMDAATMFTFEISGPRFAEYMRRQNEAQMHQSGELQPNLELQQLDHLVDMTGQGQLWVSADGLPLYQIINVEFPAESGALEQVEAEMVTEFSNWKNSIVDNSLFWMIPRIVENPSILADDPISLLPNVQAITPQAFETFGIQVGLFLIGAALIVAMFVYRESPKMYSTISLVMILSMVFAPLFQANQAHAYSHERGEQIAHQNANQIQQEEIEQLGSDERDFNPSIDPLNAPADLGEAVLDSARPETILAQDNSDLLVQNEIELATVALNTCDFTDNDGDCDGDGLTNGVELFRLGTDPVDIDSDGDLLSDLAEVQGFNNGNQWYLNPLDYDTNGDGLPDSYECPERVDVATDGTFTGVDVSTNLCRDSDGDGAPDAFDFDNDGDGVPDKADLSPTYVGDIESTALENIQINVAGVSPGATVIVEYQIRPDNPDHLWHTNNSFEWPVDKEGQITKVQNRDIVLTPMLEIRIPNPEDNDSNIVGSLPILSSLEYGNIADSDLIDTWIDNETLDDYGISVSQDPDSKELVAYVPLVEVTDQVGDTPVAWSAQMVYRPEVASWGLNHTSRVVWFVSGITDRCTNIPTSADIATFCADDDNWSAGSEQIFHIYDDEMMVTGMTVNQYDSVKTAVVAQTDALTAAYEQDLWRLVNGLNQSFSQGKVIDNGQGTFDLSDRFDIEEIKNRFDNDGANPFGNGAPELWGINNGQLAVLFDSSSTDLVDGIEFIIETQVPQLLDDTFGTNPNLSANDVVNVLTIREESSASTLLEEAGAVSVSTSASTATLSFDFTNQLASVNGTIKWSPYEYNGANWDELDVIDYFFDSLKPQLASQLTTADITAIIGSEDTINNETAAREGVLTLAKNFYLGVYQGIGTTVELGGKLAVDTSSTEPTDYLVDDASLDLGTTVQTFAFMAGDVIALYHEFMEDEAFLQVNDFEAGPVVGLLTEVEILETFGEVTLSAQGDFIVSSIEGAESGLKYLGAEFRKKILKIDGLERKKWHGRAKNAATGLGVFAGVIELAGPSLGMNEREITITTLSLSAGAEALATYDVYKVIKSAVAGSGVELLENFTKAQKAAKASALIGLGIEAGIIIAVAIATIISADLEPGTIDFNSVVVNASIQLFVAIVMAVLALIFPVGTIIVAIIALIDFLVFAICELVDLIGGEGTVSDTVDRWVCGGITGAIVEGLTELIHDVWLTVDLNAEDRLDIAMIDPVVDNEDGYIVGTKVTYGLVITSSLHLNHPESGSPIDISFTDAQLREKMRRSAMGYYLQETQEEHHDDLDFGDVNWGTDNQEVFEEFIELTYDTAGVNQRVPLYLTESYNIVNLECFGFIFTSSATCDEHPVRGSNHIPLDGVALDIFPATLDGFLNRTNWSLRWLKNGWRTIYQDVDGDGLSYAADRSPQNPDADGDGLSDSFELNNNLDPREADKDNDGLTDYWELYFGTDPKRRDTDGDGLIDGDEFYRTQASNPFVADTEPWVGGWTIAYAVDESFNALVTQVSADPLLADTDSDALIDPLERVYDTNPNIAVEFSPLSINASIETISAQQGVVGIDETVVYTSALRNETDVNEVSGNLQIEIPKGDIQDSQVISPLLPDESVTLAGSVVPGTVSETTVTSVTLRAEVLIAEPGNTPVDITNDALLNFRFDESATGTFVNSGTLGGNATCNTAVSGSCPAVGFPGQIGPSLSFTGNQPVEYPHSDDLDLEQFSVGLWIKPYTYGRRNTVRDLVNGPQSLQFNDIEQTLFNIKDSSCTNTTSLRGNQRVPEGQWSHLVATYDGSTMRVYINGVLDLNTLSYSGGVCLDETNPFAFSHDELWGQMDEVVLFDRALSDAEIGQLYDYQFGLFELGLDVPIVIDAVGPDSDLLLFTDLLNEPTLLAIETTDDYSIVRSVEVNITAENYDETLTAVQDETGTGLWYFMFEPDGEKEYTISMTATDAVANAKTTVETLFVDDTPPSSTGLDRLISTNQGNINLQNSTVLDGRITDNRGLGDYIYIDVQDWQGASLQGSNVISQPLQSGTWSDWDVEYFFPGRQYGAYTIVGDMTDAIGNRTVEPISTFFIDDYGPWADISTSEVEISDTAISGTVSDLRFNAFDRAFHFHFDEAAGATEFVDNTQFHFTADCSGGSCPLAGQSGQYGTAVQFDGTDDTLTIEANDYFELTNGTFMAWVNPTWGSNSNGYAPAILAADDGVTTGFRWEIADDYSSMNLTTASGTESVAISINPNEWTHLALIVDNGQWTGYVNGLPTETVTQSLGAQTGLPINVGSTNGTGQFFTGSVDELIVYRHAIDPEDIYDFVNPVDNTVRTVQYQLRHLNGSIWPGVDPDGLQIYIPFDDPNGTTAFDYSSYLLTDPVSCDENCAIAGLTPSPPSVLGKSLFVNNEQSVQINGTEDLNLNEISVSFYLSAPTNRNYIQYDLIGKTNASDSWRIWLGISPHADDGRVVFETPGIVQTNDSTAFALPSISEVNDGQWHHIVMTYDGQFKRIYIDGVLDVEVESTGQMIQDPNYPIYIGEPNRIGVNSTVFIDEVAIYNRALTEDEILIMRDWETWQTATLSEDNAIYTNWEGILPDGIEGLYTLALRSRDNSGNVQTNPLAWVGPVDLRGPQLEFEYFALPENNVQVYCSATDLNISDVGWVCPAGDPTDTIRQAADWYVDFFAPEVREFGLTSDIVTLNTTDDGTMTACDLHGNCTTETIPALPTAEGVTILEPVNGTRLSNFEPITIRGEAWSDRIIRQVNVKVNGSTIDVFQWGATQGATRGTFETTFTPTPGTPFYEIEAVLITSEFLNGSDPDNDGIFTDESDTIIEAPTLFVEKSVEPEIADPGDTITYTIVVGNNGNYALEDVVISDTLPVEVTPLTAVTGLSETIDLNVGELVTYTIPTLLNVGQGSTFTNTVTVEHITSTDQDSATVDVCDDVFIIRDGNTLQEAFDNICENGLITFESDKNLGNIPRDGFRLTRPFTLDGAGFDVNINLTVALADRLFILEEGNSPYIFKNIGIFKSAEFGGGDGVPNVTLFVVSDGVELEIDGLTTSVGNDNSPLITNNGQTTILNSWLTGTGGSSDAIQNDGVMTIQNSTVDVSINNSSELIMAYNTVFPNDPNAGGGEEDENGPIFSNGLTNTGTARLSGNIMVNATNDCSGSGIVDLGYNLFATGTACPTDSGNSTTVDAALLFTDVLVSIADNGGSTESHALQQNSPALDLTPRDENDCGNFVTTDQRGMPRPQNEFCDAGSYEAMNNIDAVGVNDAVTIDEDDASTIDVLANDTDVNSDPLTVESVTQPINGSVLNLGTEVFYTPNANFNGVDTFTYDVTDGIGAASTATVTVTVNPVNDAPVAGDDSAATGDNIAVVIDVLANDSDVDGDSLTVDRITQPINGVVTNNGTTVTYTPNADFVGVDTFAYDAMDSSGAIGTATVTVTVTDVNVAPVINSADTASVPEEQTDAIDVQATDDSDAEGAGLTFSLTGTTDDALFNIDSATGVVTFIDAPDFEVPGDADTNNAYQIQVTVADSEGLSTVQDITITVTDVVENSGPDAVDDSSETNEDTQTTIDVLANDTDINGDSLTIDSVTDPANGSVVNNGTDVTYTPDADFNGTDTFEYTITDGNETDTATVTMTVNPVNDAPVAVDDSASTDEDNGVTINVLANDSDLDGDSLTIDSVTDPANGIVTNNGTDVTYTPNADFNGADSFTYTIGDGNGGSDTATVNVTVNAVNDNPVAADDAQSTGENTAVIIDVLANDMDVDGDTLTVDSVTDPVNGVVVNNGTDVTYTPNAAFSGSDSFTYTIIDNNGGSDTATVTITVNNENDAPDAVDDSASTDEDNAVTIDVLDNDSDLDGDDLTIDSVTDPTNGVVVNNGTDVTYTPNADYNGADSFTYTIVDGNGGSDTATVNVTVNAVNDNPVAVDDAQSTGENTAVIIDVLANDSDVDGDTLTVDSVTDPVNGAVVNNGTDVTYTPNAAFSGSDSFTYTIIDGNGGSDTATVTITVNNENDAPDAVDDSASTDEDNAVTIDVLDNDSDLDGDDLTIDSVTDPANGVVTNNGTDVTYTPNADFNGVDSFTYTIGDGNGGSDTATVNVTVNPVNDVPVATDDAQSTAENTAVIIDVLANDSDADGDTLTVDSVTDPANGSVSNNGTDITYTPDAAFSGVDTFEYTASDGNGGTATATVTVTVNNENDAPDAVDDSTTTDEDVAVIIDVLDNDSDLDGDNLTVDSVTDPANGAVFNNGTNVTYTPDADFNGADSFTYTIIDGNGGSDTATVNVTVNAVNDNPVAADDSQSTGENMAVTIDVLANDMDVDGDDLTIDSVTDPANGAVVNNGTDVTYTPADSFFGTDTFQYTVIDGNGGSATATVTVNVNDVNDAPVAVDDTASTDEGVAVTIDVLANDSDADGDTLTVDSVTDPANGVVVNNVTDVTYTPDAGFFGTDTFEYTVIDNNGGSDTATVTVTVNEVNAAPVATDDNATTDQDVVITIDVLANDTDGDGDTLAVESTTDPANGSVVNNGTDVTYTPDAGYFGTDTFEYTVTDNNGGTDTATVTVTVNEVVVGTEADLSISKTASSETVNVEEMFTYTIVVENSGPAVATAVNVSDTLPADVNFDAIVTSQGVCTEEDGDILCELGDIESGSAATVTIDVMADSIGELSNTATVTGSEADPDLTNNEDTAVVTVVEGFFCHGVPATIVGTEGDDAIRGTNGDDVIVALGGNDTIYGRNGNDIICGGEGSDTIRGGNGDDFLKGGRGIDYIWGDRNNDIIFGGRGADELQGNSGSDVIFGGRGADVIAGQSGNDILVGNRGDDYINGGSGNDEIYGGQDDDIIEGARGNDILIGNDGDDWLLGQNGNDYIEGNDGWDDLEGGSGRDELYGGNGYDLLFGGSSVDYCDGGAGFDEGFSCETEVDIP